MINTIIRDNILKTLLYYHIFNHPLTLEEIYYFQQNSTVSKKEIKKTLNEIISKVDSPIGLCNEFYYIMPHKMHATERIKKENISKKSWEIAKVVSMIIKCFPFVRGIFITGTLSKNSSVENSDIDYLIVCKEKRLWIARTILRLFAKIFLLDQNKYSCINYYISESNLSIEDRNIFTATELAYIKVMYNTEMLHRFLQSNSWIENYFPVYSATNGIYNLPKPEVITKDKQNIVQRFLELFFVGRIGDRIDDFLRHKTLGHLQKKLLNYHIHEQKHNFTMTAGAAKFHGMLSGDNKKKILGKYHDLLRKYQICDENGRSSTALQSI